MAAYYNEIDPYAAQWLRNLIKAGHIADGEVDERDIRDVKPNEIREFAQCHFFAGIGIWSYALRQAGWPDHRHIWTGSCPCQPFSAAGKGGGFDDERHLWPAWFHLISECQPDIVLGEQVASKDGLGWFDLVQTDMEGTGYAGGAVDLCAAGVGAPHIRQRLFIGFERLADAINTRSQRRLCGQANSQREIVNGHIGRDSTVSRMAVPDSDRRQQGCKAAKRTRHWNSTDAADRTNQNGPSRPTNSFWRNADWLYCQDGKWRPVEPGTFPLVDGAASRVGRLRAYGNGICTEATQHFIESYLDCWFERTVLDAA